MDFSEWLIEKMRERGLNPTTLAERISENQPTIQRIVSGETKNPRHKLVKKIENFFNLEYETGFSANQELAVYSNIVQIKLLAAIASMGNGNEIEESEVVVDVLRLKKDWVDKNIHPTHVNNLSFIHAIGSSMSPTLNDGDILLVDSGIKTITSDCIYVLEAHNRLFVKSVRQTLNGQYEIYSDNPSVKTVDILNGDHEVTVLGRVVWVWNGRRV